MTMPASLVHRRQLGQPLWSGVQLLGLEEYPTQKCNL